ncbi:MAG: universal stress protein [Chitinophagaceae bacterium]|nr:universal stress protein [Oligoflexus sp.]
MEINISQEKWQILVPLDFAHSYENQISYAVLLAYRFEAELLLFHVLLENEVDKSVINGAKKGGGDLIEAALANLEKIIDLLPKDIVSTKIINVSKSPSRGILETALSYGIDMVVCGVANISHRFLPNALSTVLNVMQQSRFPVVLVTSESWSSLQSKVIRIMIVDDLSEACESNVKLAMTWCSRVKDCEVYHVHVHAMERESFISNDFASPLSDGMLNSYEYDPGEAYDQQHSRLKLRLKARLDSLNIEKPNHLKRFQSILLTGSVANQVFEYARSVDADILFFGKHHAFDRLHPVLGKISYRAMLQERFPVIITPMDWVAKLKSEPRANEDMNKRLQGQNQSANGMSR